MDVLHRWYEMGSYHDVKWRRERSLVHGDWINCSFDASQRTMSSQPGQFLSKVQLSEATNVSHLTRDYALKTSLIDLPALL
jgi:hypothetical protein